MPLVVVMVGDCEAGAGAWVLQRVLDINLLLQTFECLPA